MVVEVKDAQLSHACCSRLALRISPCDNAHQSFPREDLQQRDQVVSISEVFIQVCHMTLCLEAQREREHVTKIQDTNMRRSHTAHLHPHPPNHPLGSVKSTIVDTVGRHLTKGCRDTEPILIATAWLLGSCEFENRFFLYLRCSEHSHHL